MATKRTLPDYERPPLNEVVFGLQFQLLKGLRAAHLGKYWQQIAKRYPNTEEHVPVAHLRERPEPTLSRQADAEIIVESVPLVPRCWYLDAAKLQLIQVQPDRFLRNWRQLEGVEPYPRYAFLFDEFQSEWKGFSNFLRDERIGSPIVDQCELTYINHIPQGDAWTETRDLSKIFKMWAGRPEFDFLPSLELATWKISFRLPEDRGRLHVQLKQGVRSSDKRPIFVLDLTARGAPTGTDAEDIMSWFDLAHEWIVRGFTDLTRSEMHKLWGRTQ